MRLTDTWADAIYFLDEGIEARVEDAKPEGFACAYPRLFFEDQCFADNSTLGYIYVNPATLRSRYYLCGTVTKHSDLTVDLDWSRPQSAQVKFHAAPRGSTSVGWIASKISPGNRVYTRSSTTRAGVDSDGVFTALKEVAPAELWSKITLIKESTGEQHVGEWSKCPTPQYQDDIPDMKFDRDHSPMTDTHIPGETFESQVVVPADWEIPAQERLEITVVVSLFIEASDLEGSFVSDGQPGTLRVPRPCEVTFDQKVGTFRIFGRGRKTGDGMGVGRGTCQQKLRVCPTGEKRVQLQDLHTAELVFHTGVSGAVDATPRGALKPVCPGRSDTGRAAWHISRSFSP